MTAVRPALREEYFPGKGDSSYDVTHYDLTLAYRIDSNRLDGRAAIHAVARTDLDELHLDLSGLTARKVEIDAVPVSRFSSKRDKLVVRTSRVIPAGTAFRVDVRYDGRPRPIGDGSDGMGWEELSDGVIVAGQTNGAPTWFPCNDRPSNKATYRISLTTASAYHVVANGKLTEQRRGAGATTWVFEEPHPMATYLATVQIGRYRERTVPGSPVPMTAVVPAKHLDRYNGAFKRQPEMMAYFIETFGPYPFDGYTVVITDDDLDIPLESQGLATFGSNFLTEDWDSVRLVAHELAHQWFGNSLTVVEWSDIWLHEGFACYAEWLWSERSAAESAHERAAGHWKRLSDKPQDLVLGDPGPDDMFDDRVYKRGALLLHALRLDLGDETFFELLREWASRNAHGSVSTPMFVELAEEVAGHSLAELFTDWLWAEPLPALPG